jgi:hypothetical protein
VPHVFGQVTGFPQLSVAGPHALPLQVTDIGSGVQPQPFAPAPPPPHVLGGMHVF